LLIKNHKHLKINLSPYFSNYENACLDTTLHPGSLPLINDDRVSSSISLNHNDYARNSPLLSYLGNNIDNITAIESLSEKIVERDCLECTLSLVSDTNISEGHHRLDVMDEEPL
jgi:hypothetical protein